MSLKKLGGETVIYGLSNILGRLLNFVLVTPFLTRVLAAEEYGVVGELFFWTGLLIALLVFRMDTVVFRYASRAENDAHIVFQRAQWFVVVAVVTVIGGLLLFSAPLSAVMDYPDRTIYIQLVLATIAFDALSAVPLARLRLEQRPWFFVAVNLGNVLVNLLLIFLLLYVLPGRGTLFGLDFAEGYLVGYYLATIALAAGFRYLVLLTDGLIRYGKVKTEGEKARRAVPTVGVMLRYGLPLTLVAVAGIINALFGPALIKWYFGESTTGNLFWSGQFNAAMKLAVFLNLFITAYNYAAEPFFFRQAGKDLATADRTIYADAARAYALIGTLAAAAIMLLLPWLKDFLQEEEQQGLFVLPYLLGANLLFGMYSNFSIAYKLTDRTYLGGGIALIGSVIAVGGSILLIGDFGLYAVAWSMMACYAVMCALAWGVSRKYFRVNYPLGRIAVYAVLAATAVYLGGAAGAEWWIRGLVLLALLGALTGMEWRWLRKTFG